MSVSRVVRGQGAVSPAKLERVQKAIATLGYRPSHAARSLLYGTTRMIGVYIPLLSGTFYTSILQIIDTELRGIFLRADKAWREKMRASLLAKDPDRYRWVNDKKYLSGSLPISQAKPKAR